MDLVGRWIRREKEFMLVVCCETERGSSLIKLIMSERILVVLLLLVFKDFLVAEGETTNINGDCDDWEGIKCKNSRVTSMYSLF